MFFLFISVPKGIAVDTFDNTILVYEQVHIKHW